MRTFGIILLILGAVGFLGLATIKPLTAFFSSDDKTWLIAATIISLMIIVGLIIILLANRRKGENGLSGALYNKDTLYKPFTMVTYYKGSGMAYKCPTCQSPVGLEISSVDPIVGVQVRCTGCGNICLVPGVVREVVARKGLGSFTLDNIKITTL